MTVFTGRFEKEVSTADDQLVVDDKAIHYSSIKNPAELPWNSLGVNVVIESTGLFTKREDAENIFQQVLRLLYYQVLQKAWILQQ